MEAGQLQLGDRRDDPGREHDAVDEMVGELGGDRLMREPIGVHALCQQLSRDFPDRVVAGHEHDATTLQHRDCVAGRPEHALGVLEVGKLRRRGLPDDERVRLEVATCHLGEPVFVPHILVEKRAQLRVELESEQGVRFSLLPLVIGIRITQASANAKQARLELPPAIRCRKGISVSVENQGVVSTVAYAIPSIALNA